MCVTEEIALQLGFDITEVGRQMVTLANGHQLKVPKIAPIEIAFENRTYVTEAVVLGNERSNRPSAAMRLKETRCGET